MTFGRLPSVSDLVTGEAVPLELRLAKLPTRILSIAIDIAILFGAYLVLVFALAPIVAGLDVAASAAIELSTTVVVLVGIQTTVETLTRGKSVGKAALGLRVVRDDGGPIRFRHALTRWLVGVVVDFSLAGTVAVICSILNERGKRVGDILAGTVVVRERTPSTVGPLPFVPPHLAMWAAHADIAQIPDGLSVAARNYLARARELEPHVRESLGAHLMHDMSAYVSPQAPPPGTPSWAYLAAVLGERHRREMLRINPPPTPTEPQVEAPPPDQAPGSPPASPPGPAPASTSVEDRPRDGNDSTTGFAPPA